MGADTMFDPIDAAEIPEPDAEEWRPMLSPTGAKPDDFRHPKLGGPSEIWRYCNAADLLEGYVCRFETVLSDGTPSKEFRPLRYGAVRKNGQTRIGWYWKGWGENRPLYGLRELLEQPDAPVIIVEGERKADAARRLFPKYVAVSPMNGAKSPHKSDWRPLAGRKVTIWPDHDEPGLEFKKDVAKLNAATASIGVVTIPNEWPKGWDLADEPPDGVSADVLIEMLKSAPIISEPTGHSRRSKAKTSTSEQETATEVCGHGIEDTKKPKQADLLIKLATKAKLFHTPDGTGYADLAIAGHRETWRVRSREFRRWLVRQYYQRTRGAPSNEAMTSALAIIEAKAHFDGEERAVYLRIAALDDKLYLDLADAQWRVVEIDAEGWRIATEAPVRFRHSRGVLPLPAPIRGGSLAELHRLLNVRNKRDIVLIAAWLLAALRDRGPYPVLALTGEQGSAKSSLAAMLRRLVDPNMAPLRTLPRDDRDLFIAATNGHVIAIDNVSSLPPWLSDTLCRLATGGGFATRQLYTDADEVLLDAMRPIIMTGIEDMVTRGDLADRSILVRLDQIPEERRRPEHEIWAEFERAQPRILGALLDAVAHGLRHLATTRLDRLPRMADFAVWAAACEGALWEPGAFLDAYGNNRAEMDETVIEADTVAMAVRSFMVDRPAWVGAAKELLTTLAETAGDAIPKAKTWPTTPRALSGRLRRAAPNLRRIGIHITFEPRHAKGRPITITKDQSGGQPSSPSQRSSATQTNGFDADGRVTDDGTNPDTVIWNLAESGANDGRDGCDGRDAALSGIATEERVWTA